MKMTVMIALVAANLSTASPQAKNPPLPKPASDANVSQLHARVESLEQKVRELEKRIFDLSPAWGAQLDYRKSGFALTRANTGPTPVVLDSVEPYGDGFRVNVRIGNITTATLSNIRLFLNYYPLSARPAVEQRIAAEVLPGNWVRASAVISPAKQADMERLWVMVDIETLALQTPTQ